ncbi:aldehyde dehydrogenase family protein [Psychrosphaera ytuae]|uniref:Aldehyde dehydrogenase n=1 Tax=Psychrosphaera ytuae TaxID=2820710 RepID=A0A975HH17_9GAMM|nr:aldehyde dehydrogenase family protein [Psychrosphaera ytuae]QTH62701.1 aldehyde dehydrogenase family protein [Psychrosphaera ytuae]
MMEFLNRLSNTFYSGKTKPLAWRKSQLLALKRMLMENENAIYEALKKDLNKCQFESYISEYQYVLKDIKLFIKNLKKWSSAQKVSTPVLAQPGSSKLVPEPYGTVLIMGAWNYPLQLVLSPMVAAIGAGNCVVLKPSELAQATSNLLANLIPKYLDNDAFAVYEGGVEETTALLKQRFDYIMYTGSENVGKIVMRAASEYLTPVTLELGGKSPCIVDDKVNIKVTADRIVWAKFLNAGQTCIAPDYILVTKAKRAELVEALKASITKHYGEKPFNSDDYGRIINHRHFGRIVSYIEAQKDTLVHGGETDEENKFIAPTLMLNPELESGVMQEEIFGPVLPIVEVDNMSDAIRFVKDREKPLALYFFSNNQKNIDAVSQQTSAGSMCINDAVIFMVNPELPFGGVGNSGMGSYHGKWGFDTFSHLKPIMHRSFLADAPIRYAPYTSFKQKLFKLIAKL